MAEYYDGAFPSSEMTSFYGKPNYRPVIKGPGGDVIHSFDTTFSPERAEGEVLRIDPMGRPEWDDDVLRRAKSKAYAFAKKRLPILASKERGRVRRNRKETKNE